MGQTGNDVEMQSSDDSVYPPLPPPLSSPPSLPLGEEEDLGEKNEFNSDADLIRNSTPSSADCCSAVLRLANSNNNNNNNAAASDALSSSAHRRLDLIKGLLLCQLTSLLICLTGVFSSLLVTADVDIPTLQSFGNYACLCLVYSASFAYKTPKTRLKAVFKDRWWKYLLLAVFDVEGEAIGVVGFVVGCEL